MIYEMTAENFAILGKATIYINSQSHRYVYTYECIFITANVPLRTYGHIIYTEQ